MGGERGKEEYLPTHRVYTLCYNMPPLQGFRVIHWAIFPKNALPMPLAWGQLLLGINVYAYLPVPLEVPVARVLKESP